jgi:membrane protein implicated in regulation of membrane protease activity
VRVFVLLAAVPALLVVVLGYAVGHAVTLWLGGLFGTSSVAAAEAVGWTTGLLLLAVVVRVAMLVLRRRRRAGGGHQK